MPNAVADHWGTGDVYARIVAGMAAAGIAPETASVGTLAPVDHVHARGFAATRELADLLPIGPADRLLDIGCGIGGPARYLAERFGCHVDGIDITEAFITAANRLSEDLGLQGRVSLRLGDAQALPYADETYDGAISQHVAMNIADRRAFFSEAFRVIRPGGFFALTEQGLGAGGPLHYPVPWSEDGSGEHLIPPEATIGFLERAGFTGIALTETGEKYRDGYRMMLTNLPDGGRAAFNVFLLMGASGPEKIRNAARNILEGRTRPVQVICTKPI